MKEWRKLKGVNFNFALPGQQTNKKIILPFFAKCCRFLNLQMMTFKMFFLVKFSKSQMKLSFASTWKRNIFLGPIRLKFWPKIWA